MNLSLKSRMHLVLAILASILAGQVYLTAVNQNLLLSGLAKTSRASKAMLLVKDLETDILDLQRNLLIYKETASPSVKTRIQGMIEGVSVKLSELDRIGDVDISQAIIKPYDDHVDRMRTYLDQYRSQFDDVVAGRNERSELFETGIKARFGELQQRLDGIDIEGGSPQIHEAVTHMKVHLARAESASYRYLVNPDEQQIENFVNEMAAATIEGERLPASIGIMLQALRKDFTRLTQVTRGYVFLVNVVMAGAANEFLYLSAELVDLVSEHQAVINAGVMRNVNEARVNGNSIALACIVLALLIGYYLAVRIISPIRDLTSVFDRLASGEEIDQIPAIDREDDIGHLARAADVFRGRNHQTHELLLESQKLNIKLESVNKELELSRLAAEKAVVSKRNFLANMSHEIRTPMNGIMGLVQLLQRSTMSLQQQEYLQRVNYSSNILLNVINDILDFSKIEAGKLDIERVEFSVSDIFDNLGSNLIQKVAEKNLNLQFRFAPTVPDRLVGDPMRISQVLLNLCNNAVKFTDSGSVLLDIDAEMRSDSSNCLLKVKVRDTGIGIAEEKLNHIFDIFSQEDESTSRKYGGTGLGLSICKQLVELMGGTISVVSVAGEGSVFSVNFELALASQIDLVENSAEIQVFCASAGEALFPTELLAPSNVEFWRYEKTAMLERLSHPKVVFLVDRMSQVEFLESRIENYVNSGLAFGVISDTRSAKLVEQHFAQLPVPVLSHPFSSRQFRHFLAMLDNPADITAPALALEDESADQLTQYSGHVLVVEDNEINQLLMVDMLDGFGLTLDLAANGSEAVRKVNGSRKYDLVLMDIQMPVMDGYTATQVIRESGIDDTVICGLSANAMSGDREKAIEAGMDEYLTKPVDWSALEKVLATHLKKSTRAAGLSIH